MDKHDYERCASAALQVRSKGFDLAAAMSAPRESIYWLSHFLCDANRESPLGLGGQAFRRWFAGLYRNGVYIHTDSYQLGVWFASDPAARAFSGCQDSCAHGDPRPHLSDGAQWMLLTSDAVTDQMRERILAVATDSLRQAANDILRRAWVLKGEDEERAKQREDRRQVMLAAWSE